MSLGSQNIQTDYGIFAKIGGNTFYQSEFVSLLFHISLNAPPNGELRLLDRSGKGITGSESGSLMVFEFNNTSDDKTQKQSSMTCIIDSITEFVSNAENTGYIIKFTAGNSSVLNKISAAYTGNSAGVMTQVYNKFKASTLNSLGLVPLDSSIQLSDTMTWRLIAEDMWEQLTSVVNRSYIPNDYMYWTWDDVNNNLVISSLGISKSQPDKYIFIQDDSAIGSTTESKVIATNPSYTKWKFSDITRSADVGSKRSMLYPNAVISSIDSTNLVTGNLSNGCFAQTVASTGNTSGTTLQQKTNLGTNVAYGKLDIHRHNKSNMHNMYTSAEQMRNYVYSTYSKIVRVLIHNNSGPPIGSRVIVLCIPNNYRTGGSVNLDAHYSDSYIVTEKNITFDAIETGHNGRPSPTTGRQRTLITLASDNFAGDGTDAIKKAATTLKLV